MQRIFWLYIVLLSWIINPLLLIGQETVQLSGYKFIENKNQWPEKVAFRADLQAGYLYLENDGFLFDLYDVKTANEVIHAHAYDPSGANSIKHHAYKVTFKKGQISEDFKKEHRTIEYYNYFLGNDQNKWGGKAYGYHRIQQKNIYDGIAIQFYSKFFNLKYDFIVAPFADPSLIQLEYEGVDDLKIKNDRLHVYTSVNHVIEDKPYAYQIIEGKKLEVPCHYVLNENILSFSFPEGYNENYELIIDPTLMFSTYSGSFSNNFGYTATFDSKGFLYSGSSAFGSQYPTTLGAYDVSFNSGIVDIAISKFDTSGTSLIYSTYIGGSSDELPHSLIVNSFDELFILGSSSSLNYPFTTNCYDSTFNGGTPNNLQNGLGVYYTNGSDIVISHLSTAGDVLLGSTYVGGSANDGLNSTSSTPSLNTLRYNYADEVRGEIDIDENNNIYVATCTRSADFPVVGNVFQPTFGGGELDGCIIKLDNALENIIWSTFIGGENHDAIYSLSLDSNDDLYVTGGSASNSYPTTTGVLNETYKGGRSDGVITHVRKDGQQIISSSFIGSGTYDQAYFVELDKEGHVYLLGQTEIQDSTFIYNALWNRPGSGQFITKISSTLDTVIYSTVFGNGNGISISPTAFLVDLCDKIFLVGWGGGTNNLSSLYNNAGYTIGMEITTDAFQPTTDGSDFYIMVMEDDASNISYGSFFGGPSSQEHVDGGTSRFDKKGKVYQAVCASCNYSSSIGNQDFPIYPSNAVSPNNNSNCNLGVFKMDLDILSVVADFVVPPVECAPYTHNFTNTSLTQSNTNIHWDFGDGIGTSTEENPTYTYNSPGTYTVTLVLEDTSACNAGDSVQKNIIILGNNSSSINGYDICSGDQIQIGILPTPDSAITYQWSPAASLSDSSISNPFASPTTTTNYVLLISKGSCVDTVYQEVRINDPILFIPPDTTMCVLPAPINIKPNSFGTASQFIWSNNASFSDTINTNINDSSLVTSLNFSSILYLEASNEFCKATDNIAITVAPVNGSILPQDTICKSDTILLNVFNNNPGDNLTYIWQPTSAIIGSNTGESITISPNAATSYSVVIDNGYCSDTLYSTIHVDSILLTVSNDTVLCDNSSILTLNANSQGTSTGYVWSLTNQFSDTINNPFTSGSISVSPESNTTYYVMVNNENCIKIDSVVVGLAYSQTQLDGQEFICYGDTIQLEVINLIAFDSLTYDWSPDSDIISGDSTAIITVSPATPTTYYVTSVNSSGCVIIDSVRVYPDPLPNIVVQAWADDDTITHIDFTTLHVSPDGYSYTWTPSSPLNDDNLQNPIASPSTTTTFEVTVQGSACEKSDTVTLYVVEFTCEEPYIYIPNAFTPDGDGNNDVLYVRVPPTSEILFRVYDRWGELVFETYDKNVGWDGTFKGKEADPAVFDYYLEVLCPGEEKFFKKGNITLLR